MEISYHTLEADITLVNLSGRLDATTSPGVRAALQNLIKDDHLKVIVDLQKVPFIDSSGLASLVSGLRAAREKGGNIALTGVQAQAQAIFRLTMLDRIFQIYPTSDDARQNLI